MSYLEDFGNYEKAYLFFNVFLSESSDPSDDWPSSI